MTTWIIIGLLVAIFVAILKVCRLLESIKHSNEVLTSEKNYNPLTRIEDNIYNIDNRIQEIDDRRFDLQGRLEDIVTRLTDTAELLIVIKDILKDKK
jgi:hypothetical protein|tara:strand:- start:46 stop:336 length:291 start_codon:yes stop_codon:yes gene_type:complete